MPAGAIVTILGANGAGKTTILKTVSGVMDPQKGTITLEGRQIQGLDPDRVAAPRALATCRRGARSSRS